MEIRGFEGQQRYDTFMFFLENEPSAVKITKIYSNESNLRLSHMVNPIIPNVKEVCDLLLYSLYSWCFQNTRSMYSSVSCSCALRSGLL